MKSFVMCTWSAESECGLKGKMARGPKRMQIDTDRQTMLISTALGCILSPPAESCRQKN